jgi:predicted MFS family arabinose efflux permease
MTQQSPRVFSRYHIFIIAILAILQFTVILDFMVLAPLGEQLLRELSISTGQFGIVVSAYAFSAGIAGLLAAGFADRFDRKKMLLFFYAGFIIGTLLCGIAPDYHFLLIARIVTGLFGGVLGSIGFAIITDIFTMETRGRVMGFVQMAFAASQILGIPAGLYLANHFGWHSPFLMIVGFSIVVALVVMIYMKPVNAHLQMKSTRNPFVHLGKTLSFKPYARAFAATTLLATGGFMMMPFGSAFSIHNMGITNEELPLMYGITGIFSIILGPMIGKLSDKVGKYKIFVAGTLLTMTIVAIYTHLGITPFSVIVAINVIMFAGISSRMISASALMTAIPEPQDRGAFMSINSSVQQISGGFASAIAGMIVVQTPSGKLENYNILGYVVLATMLFTIIMMYFLNRYVSTHRSMPAQAVPAPQPEPLAEAV